MSAYDYCRDKVALPGSSLYYSLLFVTPGHRQALTALHAAVEEFREVAEEVSDAGVARSKLGWWAEEMQRAYAGEPRHPVTLVLATPVRQAGIDAERFVAVLNAFAAHQQTDAYRTFEELESHCERVADAIGCMAAELCGFSSAATLDASRHLGVGLTLTELARDPDGARAGHAGDMRALLGAARVRLRRGLDEMPAPDHGAQRSRRALAEMTLARIGAIERGGYAAGERSLAASPLHKLWIAWKHRS